MRIIPSIVVAFMMVGCGGAGKATVSGDIEGIPFEESLTVMHGNAHVVLLDRKLDCLDLAWVNNTYVDGKDPTGGLHQFVGLQFTFDNGSPIAGNFSVSPDAPVKGLGLVNDGSTSDGEFTFYRSRGGFIEVSDVSDDTVEASFEIQFSSGTVSGEFVSEYCRNLR